MERAGLARRERGALWASCAAVVGALVLVEPGRIVPETKLDVLLDPVGMLGRALGAWDPTAGFGRLQNQAVGYLFPMGAFSATGRAVGLPPWLVQRLWLALVTCLALWGAHRVARAIGVGGPGERLVAAWAYALAPATLSLSLFQSAGQLPYALVPHVLAPLLAPRPGEVARRTAARSTLWLAAMGGVNGASAIAVLPLVALWFLTRAAGRARRTLAGWWVLGAAAATLWWLIPLVVSVRWGVRFTDYTEAAATTTVTESATEVLRGTGSWLSYLETSTGSWLPGSWALAAAPLAIAATTGLAAAGVAGLVRRDAPERRWLGAALLLGAAAMGAGWSGRGGGPLASTVQDLLDGPLAPFRNVHKLAAVVRLPLALGLGHLVAVAAARGSADGRPPLVRRLPAAAAAAGVLLAIVPMVRAGATAPGAFDEVPAAWRDAAAWLDEHDDGGRSLVLPGSSFGEYRWGRPLDEPLASLLDGDWAVRDLVPLGGDGSTRLLDGIDAALATDALPPGFVAALERAGVGHLVVRNDLDLARTGGPSPATVRRLLAGVEGVELVASFGPVVDPVDAADPDRPALRPGAPAEEIRQIEVYAVDGAVAPVATYPVAGTLVATGGPEGLLAMDPQLLDGRAVVLSTDAEGTDLLDAEGSVVVQTDSARRRDVQFGDVRDQQGATLEADQRSPLTGEAPVDRWPAGSPIGLSVAQLDGAAAVRDSRRPGGFLTPEAQPYAAFDGNPDTAWIPQRGEVGEWIEVELAEPTALERVAVRTATTDGRQVRAVRIILDGDEATAQEVAAVDGAAELELGREPVRTVRVELADIGGETDLGRVGLAEVTLVGADGAPVAVRRPIVAAPVPGEAGAGADVLALSRDRRDRMDRVRRDEDGRFDRLVRWAGGPATISGTAVVGDGAAAVELLRSPSSDPDEPVTVDASSTYRDHPAVAADRALDGDPTTAWVSDDELDAPALRLSWDRPVVVDSLEVQPLTVGVDQVATVEVNAGDVRQTAQLDASGRVELAEPVRSSSLTLSFPGPAGRGPTARRVGIAEVVVPALGARSTGIPANGDPLELACGEGPELRIDGEAIPTRASATVGDLRSGRAVAWEACGPVALDAGEHRIEAERGALFPATIQAVPAGGLAPPGDGARTATVRSWGAAARTVELGAGEATILATTENANEGWRATFDGEELDAVRVDGWRQGWRVPAGEAGTVELRYGPDRVHRGGLALGALALALLVAAALVPARRRADGDGADPLGIVLSADARWGVALVAMGTVAAGLALAGPLVLVAVPLWFVPSLRRWAGRIAVLAVVGAGTVALLRAGAGLGSEVGTFSAPAQWLAALALVATGTAVAAPGIRREGPAGSTPSSPPPSDRRGP